MSTVREQSNAMASLAESWPMVDALLGGTAAMRKAGKSLLPKWPNEEEDSYRARLAVATLHPVFRRTVLVNAARPFSKPPSITATNVPAEWLDNADLQGTSLAQFANGLLALALAYGVCGVLVDFPRVDGVRTRAEEQRAGLRPYLVHYRGSDILGWRAEGGQLTQLRLLERAEVNDGDWATKTVEQVRVLTPGAWQVYQLDERNPAEWVLVDEGTTSLPAIPFVFVYGLRQGLGLGLSPLSDLAYQNVEHYQSSSDQQTILHVARVPILVALGFGDAPLTIGASSAVSSDNLDAKLSYTEHTGTAIEAGRQAILDLEERMRATGAELISKNVVMTTATQVSAEGEAVKSTLQQIVESLEDSLEEMLVLMGLWVRTAVTVEVGLFKSYDQVAQGDHQVLAEALKSGVISGHTMFEELQRRDVLSLDRTWSDETSRMKANPPPTAPGTSPTAPPNASPSVQNAGSDE
jgi:hypothetical protein